MKEVIKNIFSLFTVIATGILFVVALSTTLYQDCEIVSTMILWQILTVAAATALSSAIYYIVKIPFKLRVAIHYTIIVVEVFQAAYLFGWFAFDCLKDYLVQWGCVTFVYAVVCFVQFRSNKVCTDNVNEMLKKRNSQ